ncbi:hypothetical protein HPB51_016989 [Rhipicephalus microplus]|uniref:General transcription and DNA repair factor IIH subunit TFB5 n=1 Tax=Rhipicephalus microplus TaxID=6941 RepID=A0A9J6F628_RHIMP|nr:hypothetical protein HPB51_016989 [Rhipicephalus microplus]
MKQFLLHLDDTNALGKKFIIQDLDETHVFITAEILETLQSKIDDIMDQISFRCPKSDGVSSCRAWLPARNAMTATCAHCKKTSSSDSWEHCDSFSCAEHY